MLLGSHVLSDVHGGGVEHGDKLGDLSAGEEADCVGVILQGVEGEACGHVELAVEDDALVVLVDDDPYFLPLFVLCRHVHIFLFPVGVQFKLYFVVQLRLQDEIVEPSADERVRPDVRVRHVVLRPDLLFLPLHYLALACILPFVLCCNVHATHRAHTTISNFPIRLLLHHFENHLSPFFNRPPSSCPLPFPAPPPFLFLGSGRKVVQMESGCIIFDNLKDNLNMSAQKVVRRLLVR